MYLKFRKLRTLPLSPSSPMLSENFAASSNAVQQKIETILGTAWLSLAWAFSPIGIFLFPHIHPSTVVSLLLLRLPLHLFIRDHYLGPIMTSIIFCYCSVYRVMAGRGLEHRGSLAPRRIIRCRYAITTFASAKWKRFRFFAPAPDGRWLCFSEPTIAFGVAERGEKAGERMREKADEIDRLIGDKLYTLGPP